MFRRRFLFSLLAALALFALVVGTSACGDESDAEQGAVEGKPVKAGALSVTVLASRYLDTKDKEDAVYLVRQSPAGKNLNWFGVFVEVENEGERSKRSPTMMIVDSTGRTYSAFPSESPQAYHFSELLKPGERLPEPGAKGQRGPDKGAVVIFRLGNAAVKNQPLTLHIEGFHRKEADVKLDRLEPQ